MTHIHPVVSIGIIVCFILLVVVLYEHKIKQLLIRGIIGPLMISGVNLLIPESCRVALDWISVMIVTVLGIPGIILLYIIQGIQFFIGNL